MTSTVYFSDSTTLFKLFGPPCICVKVLCRCLAQKVIRHSCPVSRCQRFDEPLRLWRLSEIFRCDFSGTSVASAFSYNFNYYLHVNPSSQIRWFSSHLLSDTEFLRIHFLHRQELLFHVPCHPEPLPMLCSIPWFSLTSPHVASLFVQAADIIKRNLIFL